MAYVNTPIELAKCIDGMSYTGLLSAARDLVEMNAPGGASDRDPATPHGMADTLADWAESVVAEENERLEAARAAAKTAA